MADVFSFRQFTVHQALCGMKVGTDGVLLGAWARGGKKVLDIGTGTGLIAMMLAQRCPSAVVTAIDIEPDACLQARMNVDASLFKGRIKVEHVSVQQFARAYDDVEKFDCIVSNPPFFINSLKSRGDKRTMARHTDSLSFAELFRSVHSLLTPMGEFSAIIPTECIEDFVSESYIQGFFMSRKCLVKTIEGKPAKRCLIAFNKHNEAVIEENEECMMTREGEKTAWYRGLTDSFYLK